MNIKVLFEHIPKSGGTSMIETLQSDDNLRVGSIHQIIDKGLEFDVLISGHHRLSSISEIDYDLYWKCAVVRNPYDRFVSVWRCIRHSNSDDMYDDINEGNKERLLSYCDIHDFIINCADYSSAVFIFKPMSYFLEGLEMDYIGFYERIEETWKVISDRCGCTRPLSRINVSRGKIPELTPLDKLRLYRYYKDDFDRYYPTDPNLLKFSDFLSLCKLWVINLDDCVARLENFQSSARSVGLTIDRFSAVDGSKMKRHDQIPYPPDNRPNRRSPTNFLDMSAGQIACALSHLTLMEQCITDNVPYVVFEDDAVFCSDFMSRAQNCWGETRFDGEHELIMLGHNLDQVTDELVTDRSTWNMHAYMYTPSFCKRFIRYIKRVGLFCIDINLIEYQELNKGRHVAWLRPSNGDKGQAHVNRHGGLVYQANKFKTEIGRTFI